MAGLQPNTKISTATVQTALTPEEWQRLLKSLQQEGTRIMNRLGKSCVQNDNNKSNNNNNNNNNDNLKKEESLGFILYRENKPTKDNTTTTDDKQQKPAPPPLPHADKILEQFQPHLLKQHDTLSVMSFPTFSQAIDEFFVSWGSQKRALRYRAAESAATEKLEKIRRDQQHRVEALQKEQTRLLQHARILELHADDVDKALMVINSALDSGMDWEALQQLLRVEQENQNPIAMLIKRLKLEEDEMVLELEDILDNNNQDDDAQKVDENVDQHKQKRQPKTIDITVSLKEGAHGNARDMFAKYRAQKEKSQKTMEASSMALKAAEANAQRQLQEAQKKNSKLSSNTLISAARKPFWFEKFHWFITSDNYIVLGGKDAHQNEMLVKRYLRQGDAYLHADVHGASSCILRAKRRRNPSTGRTEPIPLPDQALREAGNFTICRSSAWSSRMVTSAWWVEANQVSKTAPTGEYLTVGSFMIRGKKNFLPPTQLEMGLGVLFRLGDEDSLARHKNERRDFALMEAEAAEAEVETTSTAKQRNGNNDANMEEKAAVSKPANNRSPIKAEKKKEQQEPTEEVSAESAAKDSEKVELVDNVAEEPQKVNENIGDSACTSAVVENNEEKKTEAEDTGKATTVPPDKESDAEANAAPKKKKGLSVKDRKLIKKYGSLEAAQKAAEERAKIEKDAPKQTEIESVATESTQRTAAATQAPVKRGKKGKMKKLARKYADQDDEDRELALLALHGGEKKDRERNKISVEVASENQERAAAETAALLVKDASEAAQNLSEKVRSKLADCVTVKSTNNDDESTVRWDKFDGDVLEQLAILDEEQQAAAAERLSFLKQTTRVDNFSASLSGIIRTIRKYGHQNLMADVNIDSEGARRKTKEEKEKEKDAWKESLAEEGIVEGDGNGEEGIDDTVEISKLTGKPMPEDSLLYAIPVCAPYQTLSQYKYRVKLTPGSQKRGKASKQCLEMFLKGEKDKSAPEERNRDLIKRVGDNDWVQAMCADVKISAPGASKIAKKQKGKGGGKGKKKK